MFKNGIPYLPSVNISGNSVHPKIRESTPFSSTIFFTIVNNSSLVESLKIPNSISENNSKNESKKLMIKLETNGKEKRKILLKLESGSSAVHSSNYNLISELLKEFFNGANNFK